jgi:hypothetical protein
MPIVLSCCACSHRGRLFGDSVLAPLAKEANLLLTTLDMTLYFMIVEVVNYLRVMLVLKHNRLLCHCARTTPFDNLTFSFYYVV